VRRRRRSIYQQLIDAFRVDLIRIALFHTNSRREAAKLLGISVRTIARVGRVSQRQVLRSHLI